VTKPTPATKSLLGKTALVTGATRGLGNAIALQLAREGAHVVALGRSVGALEELDDQIKSEDGQATLAPLDFLEDGKLDALGPTLFPRFDKLDILIGNAAYLGGLAPLTHLKTEEWEKIITTNLTANWQLIRSLHPLLNRAEKATALFIGCDEGQKDNPAYWGAYNASKAGLKALVESYKAETNETNITVEFFVPPAMDTNLNRKAYPGGDKTSLTPVETAATDVINLVVKSLY
jgi:NAD(P)-dependent dehydrogenase (short-subunit alcohol dehydrogenase family)